MTPEIVIILLVLSFFGEIKENFLFFFVEMGMINQTFCFTCFSSKIKTSVL
jgi:hypothetical protein